MEQQIARIDESLKAVTLDRSFELQDGAPDRDLGFLLAKLEVVLRLHLRREEHLYLTALRNNPGRDTARDILRRMSRVYGEDEPDPLSTGAAALWSIS